MRGMQGTRGMFTMIPRNLLEDSGECSHFSIPGNVPEDSGECSRRLRGMLSKIPENAIIIIIIIIITIIIIVVIIIITVIIIVIIITIISKWYKCHQIGYEQQLHLPIL